MYKTDYDENAWRVLHLSREQTHFKCVTLGMVSILHDLASDLSNCSEDDVVGICDKLFSVYSVLETVKADLDQAKKLVAEMPTDTKTDEE